MQLFLFIFLRLFNSFTSHREKAHQLYLAACVCIKKAEWSWITVRRVKLSQGKVYWFLHNPGRGTSPQPACPQTEPLPQRLGQPSTWRRISNPTPWEGGLAHEEGARQESTSRKDHGAGWDLVASICWKDVKRSDFTVNISLRSTSYSD